MTVSALDPRTALVVVDLQKGTIGSHPMAHPAENVIGRAAELAAAFRQRGLPVVLVRHAGNPAGRTRYGQGGGDWPPELTELVPGLGAEPGDLRVTKHSWSAFAATGLDATPTTAATTSRSQPTRPATPPPRDTGTALTACSPRSGRPAAPPRSSHSSPPRRMLTRPEPPLSWLPARRRLCLQARYLRESSSPPFGTFALIHPEGLNGGASAYLISAPASTGRATPVM
jgi:hypothetical protein